MNNRIEALENQLFRAKIEIYDLLGWVQELMNIDQHEKETIEDYHATVKSAKDCARSISKLLEK